MIIDNEHNESRIREDFVIREDSNGTNQPQEVSTGSGSFSYNMDETWIKLYRRVEKSDIWDMRAEYFKIWCYLLMRANHYPTTKSVRGVDIPIDVGEVWTSQERIAIDCRTTKQIVRSCLKWCSENALIVSRKCSDATHITICKYKDLQEKGVQDVRRKWSESAQKVHLIKNKEVKNKEIKNNNNVSMYAPSSSELAANLLQNDGFFFPITKDQAARWQELYPAVNVATELSKIIGWLEANPTKRKTKRGMLSFVNRWLSREQDKGAVNAPQATKYTVGDRQAVIDYKTSHKQLEAERDAVTEYLIGRAREKDSRLAISTPMRLTNGKENSGGS